jgi:hypothetical protein
MPLVRTQPSAGMSGWCDAVPSGSLFWFWGGCVEPMDTRAAEIRQSTSAPQTEGTMKSWTPEMQAAVDAQRYLDAAASARAAAAAGNPEEGAGDKPLTCSWIQSMTGGKCVTNWAMVGLLGAGALVMITVLKR